MAAKKIPVPVPLNQFRRNSAALGLASPPTTLVSGCTWLCRYGTSHFRSVTPANMFGRSYQRCESALSPASNTEDDAGFPPSKKVRICGTPHKKTQTERTIQGTHAAVVSRAV